MTDLTVLVVDDDAVTRVDVQDYLSEAGFRVHEASSGEAGLEAFERLRPDLVLLDVTMPGMDGFTVCETLRASEAGRHTLIVMLTGHEDAGSVERAYECGATDFVTKPLNCPLLFHRLQYLLRAKGTSDELRASRESLALAQRIARLGSWSVEGTSRRLEHSAETATILLGAGREGPLSLHRAWRAVHREDRRRLKAFFRAPARSDEPEESEFRVVHADGDERVVRIVSARPEDGATDAPPCRGTIQDITDRSRAQAKIRELAYFDTVTALPNRVLLTEHLERTLTRAGHDGHAAGLLFVDLDRFKLINDHWGHEVGDLLLKQVAARFEDGLRRTDVLARGVPEDGVEGEVGAMLARLGGDEFVLLLPHIRSPESATAVAQRILDSLARPFVVEGTEIYVTASIGISTYPEDGTDAATLLKRADTAMYATKRERRNGFRVSTGALQSQAGVQLDIEARLRGALERGEFAVHYQPLVAASDGSLIALEALVRWNEPGRGMVSPAEFIGVAEDTGLIVPLGAWVLDTACRDIRRVHEAARPGIVMSVNLSAAQLRHASLLETVHGALDGAGVAPGSLELELTESMLMSNMEHSLSQLHALRAAGVSLSIDDFGTGYSSLGYMKQLPVQVLKIDRCFVKDLVTDPSDAAIVRGTIQLAHSLGLTVVAEGVEERAQRDLLREYGCDRIQGYYYSRPLPLGEVLAWIADHERAAEGGRQVA